MKKSATYLAVLLIGFLLGLSAMNLFHARTIDRLYRIQNQLTNQLLDKEIKLERLNKSIENQKYTIVKDLELDILFEGNPIVKDQIEKTIYYYLGDLVGKELSVIDGEMVYKILHNRIIDADNKQIRLHVRYIIINEKISISVEAKLIQ